MPDYFLYRLNELPAELADETLLDGREQEVFARRGLPYLLERSLLKREIAARLGMDAHDVRLQIGGHGKPHFPGIHFNISHSGGLLCLAFHSNELGVDIERARPRKHMEQLAERVMAPEQLQAFRERGSPLNEFYDCWCAAEALVKHRGGSIWQAREHPFLCKNGRILPLRENMPQVELFEPAEGYRGAIAYS